MAIYKFQPIRKVLVWGTETWLISSVPGSESVVAEGPDKGKTINEVYGGQFPLLVKFIDAREDLSIQVHPNDALALRRHNCKGKTEMWYVRDASEGAHLLSGLTRQITPEEYERRVAGNTITEVLGRYDIAKGDVFFLPAGRIHAIGGGSHIVEIQQTSDITYRIYDYGRPGLDGKPRELHTRLAKDAIDYSVLPDYRTRYNLRRNARTVLVECPCFVTSLYDLDRPLNLDLSAIGSAMVVVCIEGGGTLGGRPVAAGDVFLVTSGESDMSVQPGPGGLKLLTSYVPEQTIC